MFLVLARVCQCSEAFFNAFMPSMNRITFGLHRAPPFTRFSLVLQGGFYVTCSMLHTPFLVRLTPSNPKIFLSFLFVTPLISYRFPGDYPFLTPP